MTDHYTIKRGAVWTAPVGPAGLAGRIVAGAVALLLILGAYGDRAWAITGGEVDEDNTYSNVGCIVPDVSAPSVGASGILIHPRVLLTAGHVTIFPEQNPWLIPPSRVSFGTDAFDPSTWHEVEAVITHPKYNNIAYGTQSRNDVGVVILKEPIYDLPLATLPYAGFLDELQKAKLLREPGQGGTPFKVAGYGSTLEWAPPVMTDGDGWRRFADSDYLALLPGWLLAQQNFATGNGGTGCGDSGGPAFWIQPDGRCVLVALTGHGDPKCLAMNFYWRVDIPETLDFVAQVIEGLEE
jgi:hypothetical protein